MANINNKNKGAALITVLIIVFFIMAIITNLTVQNYRVIRRLTNQKIQDQAYSIMSTAIDFGRAGLATSGATSAIDTLTDIWAQPLPKTKILDDIQMSGYIIDARSKFNINDLITSDGSINLTGVKEFSQLLKNINMPIDIATNIANYMQAPVNQADIMKEYIAMGYRPSGRPLVDLSELLFVKDLNKDIVTKLNKYTIAIPKAIRTDTTPTPPGFPPITALYEEKTSPININTASAEVIAAKSGISLNIAQRATTIRNKEPFKNQNDVNKFLASSGIIAESSSNINVSSEYFVIHATIDSGDYQFNSVALVQRNPRSGQWPRILWQHPQ